MTVARFPATLVSLLATIGFSADAQPSTSICNLPGLRGTAAYNRYCTGAGPVTVAPAAPTYDPTKTVRAVIAASTDFHVIKAGGRVFTAAEMSGVPFEIGDEMVTGPEGRAQILLPDETIFTLGPGSDMVFDDFIFDPATSSGKISAVIAKGLFRFVTGKIAPHDPQHLNVKIAVGTIGVRGTDIEFEQSPDGSGYVKLFSGLADLTPYDTDTTIELHPGQMITWTDYTKLSGPKPIE
jgi:hypothetical protein